MVSTSYKKMDSFSSSITYSEGLVSGSVAGQSPIIKLKGIAHFHDEWIVSFLAEYNLMRHIDDGYVKGPRRV